MGASPADARDVNSAIASIMRAGAMELWNMRNQVQQQLEIERGISALDKRDKVKAAEHRKANKTLTGRQKAARREATSAGKVHRDPLRDSRGVVIARYCVEIDCTQLTDSTGRFCPSCEAGLPSRARKFWNPMARVKLEKWEGERRYWKARLTEKLRDGGDGCLLYTSPSPRDLSTSRMPSSA